MMFKSLIVVLLFSVVANAEIKKFSDANVKDLDGNDVSFKKYDGKCVLVINTASGCGFTNSNMKYLNELHKTYPDLAIVAFPSNSFGQEPKTNPELKDWFNGKWEAKYSYFAPADVKESDVYKFLIKQAGGKSVVWNYGKYVIEKDGVTAERFGPQAGAILPSGLKNHLEKCLG